MFSYFYIYVFDTFIHCKTNLAFIINSTFYIPWELMTLMLQVLCSPSCATGKAINDPGQMIRFI